MNFGETAQKKKLLKKLAVKPTVMTSSGCPTFTLAMHHTDKDVSSTRWAIVRRPRGKTSSERRQKVSPNDQIFSDHFRRPLDDFICLTVYDSDNPHFTTTTTIFGIARSAKTSFLSGKRHVENGEADELDCIVCVSVDMGCVSRYPGYTPYLAVHKFNDVLSYHPNETPHDRVHGLSDVIQMPEVARLMNTLWYHRGVSCKDRCWVFYRVSFEDRCWLFYRVLCEDRCWVYRERSLTNNTNNNSDQEGEDVTEDEQLTDEEAEEDEEEEEEGEDDKAEEPKKGQEVKKEEEDEGLMLDRMLFVWHAALLIVCFSLLSVGIVLRFFFTNLVMSSLKNLPTYEQYANFVRFDLAPQDLYFGDLVTMLGNSLIILNAAYIMCIVMYMSFLIHRNPFTLPLVGLVSGAVILTEVNVINVYMSPDSFANEKAVSYLKKKLMTNYTIDDSTVFSLTYDIISIWGECCGINDQYDFPTSGLRYMQPSAKIKTYQVPPTCCRRDVFQRSVTNVFQCAETGDHIYTKGCYVVLYDWLREYSNKYSIVVVLQLIDMFIHLTLYKKYISALEDANEVILGQIEMFETVLNKYTDQYLKNAKKT